MRTRIAIGAAAALGAALALSFVAFAAPPPSTPATTAPTAASKPATATPKPPKPSIPATRAYDLDFTLPTAGQSGCMVCHGDFNLVRIDADTTSSIFVDAALLEDSAHPVEETPCTGCHLDYAATAPHKQSDYDWAATAKQACKNCHAEAFGEYASGAHSPAGTPGVEESVTAATRVAKGSPPNVPMCGDCHGGHGIPSKEDTAAQEAVQLSGVEMCGGCHVEESDTYSDPWHGAAYKRGALDAPSCWDCHGFHKMLEADDRLSPVNEAQLTVTCGQEGCHLNVDEEFVAYAENIHGRQDLYLENPLVSAVAETKETVQTVRATVSSWF